MTTLRELAQAAMAFDKDSDDFDLALWDILQEHGIDFNGVEALETFLAALDAERDAVHAWRLVDTAPDGTWIMTWDMVGDWGDVACCLDGVWWSRNGRLVNRPTHWQPLPAPPEVTAQREGAEGGE